MKTLARALALYALIVAALHIEAVEDLCMTFLNSELVERWWD